MRRFLSRAALTLCLLPAFAAEETTDPRVGPYVWWHWCGTAVTKEGIVRDLDAMAESGICGAAIFQVARGPCSEVIADGYEDDTRKDFVFGNDNWFDMVAFAAKEAKARGLEIGMHNCPGYTVSGGPWITPELAMKKLVWSSADAGSVPPRPETNLGFYREIGRVDVAGKTYRFGYTCTGSQCMPVAKALWGKCLEADKMSARAAHLHLDHVLRRKPGLDFILMDSYEAGSYDWTDDFREAFIRRRGYDPLPHLPAYVGAVSNGADRIRADMSRTVKELSTERHYWVFRDRLHAEGLAFIVEPYGGPFDQCEAAYASDMPTTEFWGSRPFWVPPGSVGGHPQMGGAAGRAAGRTILAAEAYTAMPFDDPYVISPRDLKAPTDASFARGINRMFLHHWVHQPFPACRKPGMSMGYWGTHFGQNQTWYEPGKAFFAYLTRCQRELQQGEEVIDVLAVEDFGGRTEGVDIVPVRVFTNDVRFTEKTAFVGNRTFRRYPFLAVPHRLRDDPSVGRQIERARAAGVTVLDETAPMPKRPFAVVGGVSVGPNGPVLGTSRIVRADGRRFFFVANVSTNRVEFDADFRAEGEATLWYPESDERARGKRIAAADGSTRLRMALGPQESVFVTFGATCAYGVRNDCTVARRIPVDCPWRVMFQAGRGAPSGVHTFDRLVSWSGHAESGIRYFSGTATYRTTVIVTAADAASREVRIDLGDVRDIAAVRLNGRDLGVAWHEPFTVRATGALTAGANELEIEVTNGWHNRLLGDHLKEGDDCTWGPLRSHMNAMDGTHETCGRGLKRIPDWAWRSDGWRPAADRVTFTSWDYFDGSEKPRRSGLLGPVKVCLYRE